MSAVVGAFCRRIENCPVLSWFYLENFIFFSDERKFAHTVWAGVVGFTRDDAVVSYHCGFVEYFFASLVRALEFIFVLVPVENLQSVASLYAYNSSVAIFNKPNVPQISTHISTTQLHNHSKYHLSTININNS
jgi:hypothetical protein